HIPDVGVVLGERVERVERQLDTTPQRLRLCSLFNGGLKGPEREQIGPVDLNPCCGGRELLVFYANIASAHVFGPYALITSAVPPGLINPKPRRQSGLRVEIRDMSMRVEPLRARRKLAGSHQRSVQQRFGRSLRSLDRSDMPQRFCQWTP